MNAWNIAAFEGELNVMKNIWELAKERLITDEIKNEMLLRRDHNGMNAWNIAAFEGELYVMKEVWVLCKERSALYCTVRCIFFFNFASRAKHFSYEFVFYST